LKTAKVFFLVTFTRKKTNHRKIDCEEAAKPNAEASTCDGRKDECSNENEG